MDYNIFSEKITEPWNIKVYGHLGYEISLEICKTVPHPLLHT